MRISIIIISILFAGCDEARIYGGFAAGQAEEGSGWEEHKNPLGFIRAEANAYIKNGFFLGSFGQHTSSAATQEDKSGLNYIGVHGGYTWGGRP